MVTMHGIVEEIRTVGDEDIMPSKAEVHPASGRLMRFAQECEEAARHANRAAEKFSAGQTHEAAHHALLAHGHHEAAKEHMRDAVSAQAAHTSAAKL